MSGGPDGSAARGPPSGRAAGGYAAAVRSGLMNAPLWVTGVRIVAIPPLMALLLIDDIPGGRWWAFTVFVVASLGWRARAGW